MLHLIQSSAIVALFLAIGLVVLGILVLVHEMGHFVAAKCCGIRVLAFSIGFGKPLFVRTVNGTDYKICAIPFGGYVAMAGEHPEENQAVNPGDFTSKPIWQRALVAIAGPAANYLFAMMCLYAAFAVGVNEPEYLRRPVVGAVLDSSAAWKAGILAGDSIAAMNGKPMRTWEDVEMALALRQPAYEVSLVRDGTPRTAQLVVPQWRGRGLPKDPTGGLFPLYTPVIGYVRDGTPAAAAGFKGGDTVVAIDGERIVSWGQLTQRVTRFDSTQGPMRFLVKRGADTVLLSAAPAFNDEAKTRQIGVARGNSPSVKVRYGLVGSVRKMLAATWDNTTLVFKILGLLSTQRVSTKELTGPVGIVQWIGIVAMSGPIEIIRLMALIGINLAVLNLLPLVITDGGLLLFLLIEAIRRKPLSLRLQSVINRAALAFFVLLFLYVTYNDLWRLPDLIKVMTGH
jgi:regulator of sigma E protease